jgi:hypothetical protein
MKKLLKVILPPFVGFALYFLGVRYSPQYFDLTIGQIGTGTVTGFMAYYKYALPLIFVVAILTQLLIVMPAWNNVIHKPRPVIKRTIGLLVLICLLFAAGIGFLIWDRPSGTTHLIKTCVFLAAVQLVYWGINLFTLFIIE